MGQSVRRKAGTLPVLPSPLRGGVGGGVSYEGCR